MPSFEKIIGYLVLVGIALLGFAGLALAVLGTLGIADVVYVHSWGEYLSAGLLFTISAGLILLGAWALRTKGWEACMNESRNLEKAEETAIEALGEHLRRIGLSAIVESRVHPSQHSARAVVGSVRVTNRNIDLVELERSQTEFSGDDWYSVATAYRCNFVLQTDVDGLEDKLGAISLPVKVRKGFLRNETVGLRWKGKELAETLNNDTSLSDTLYRVDPDFWEIKHYRKQHLIRITKGRWAKSPQATFPTAEAFDVCDRIAQHIRSIANIPH